MPVLRNMARVTLAALVATLLVGGSQASAIELSRGGSHGAGAQQQLLIQNPFQSLQDEQMRRDYQLQQQFYREQDRPHVRPQHMEIPIMRQGCGYPPGCQ